MINSEIIEKMFVCCMYLSENYYSSYVTRRSGLNTQ